MQSFVYGNDLYAQYSPHHQPIQLTFTGNELYVFNGVPDWLYEGTGVNLLYAVASTPIGGGTGGEGGHGPPIFQLTGALLL